MTEKASEEINLYIEAIGKNTGDDYILRPKQHGDALPGNAGSLARILRQPELQEICAAYDTADERAVKVQSSYKFWAKLAIWLVFLAIVIGSFSTALPLNDMIKSLPLGTVLDGELAEYSLRLISIIFLLVALIVSFAIMLWMEWANPYEKWNKDRGLAEHFRKELFRAVFASNAVGTPVAGELKALPLKLEYFRRYLLGDQMAFYKSRAADFKKSERNTRFLWLFATIAVFFILLATVFIGIISPSSEQGAAYNIAPSFTRVLQIFEVAHLDRYILAIGIALAALFGAKLATSLLDKAKGNALRYETTYSNLLTLQNQHLAVVRQKALIGDDGAVKTFVNRIMAQVSAEHQDWVKLQALAPKQTPAPTPSPAVPAE